MPFRAFHTPVPPQPVLSEIVFLRSQSLRAAPVVKEESQNSTKELKSFCYSAPIELEVTFGLSTTLVEL